MWLYRRGVLKVHPSMGYQIKVAGESPSFYCGDFCLLIATYRGATVPIARICSTNANQGHAQAQIFLPTIYYAFPMPAQRFRCRVNALGEPLPKKASSLKRPARPQPDLSRKEDQQASLPDRKIVVEPLEWCVVDYISQHSKYWPLDMRQYQQLAPTASTHNMNMYWLRHRLFRYRAVRCQMSDYRSTEASTLMLMSLRKDFMPQGLFLVRVTDVLFFFEYNDHVLGAAQWLLSRHVRVSRTAIVCKTATYDPSCTRFIFVPSGAYPKREGGERSVFIGGSQRPCCGGEETEALRTVETSNRRSDVVCVRHKRTRWTIAK